MTGMSATAMEWLEGRGLDVELCDRLGLSSQGAGGDEVLVYPCVRAGHVARRKFRRLTPGERPRFFSEKGGVACAFNEDVLRDDALAQEPLVVTEGYEDCIAALQARHERSLSVPDGAPETPVEDIHESKKYQWIDEVRDLLRMDRVREIILAVDGDPAGAALMHDLSVKFGRSRCKFITYPLAKDPNKWGRDRLKDLNEVLIDYGVSGVRQVLARAQWLKVNGVYAMSELPPLPEATIYDIGFEAFSEHYKMRLGDLAVFTGIPGYGKTTFITDMVNRVVTKYGVRVAWASFEQSPQRDHKRALRSWFSGEREFLIPHNDKAKADAWINEHHRFMVPDDEDDASLQWLMERMEAAVVQHGCKVIVVDPWNEIFHNRGGDTETDYTNRSIRDLKRFAKVFQIHLIVVAHPAKLQRREDGLYNTPSLYDIAGSAAWANKPDLGVVIHRTDAETTIVKTAKSRFWDTIGKPGIVAMHFNGQTRRYVEVERGIGDEPTTPKRRKSM